ncbi:MAG TPA: hypothetical protein VHI93_01370 [Candidatus Thermoplasmatota archaeon]|nr:hypothetical protein [Candidatus Thermoplasmatota archaeon]
MMRRFAYGGALKVTDLETGASVSWPFEGHASLEALLESMRVNTPTIRKQARRYSKDGVA